VLVSPIILTLRFLSLKEWVSDFIKHENASVRAIIWHYRYVFDRLRRIIIACEEVNQAIKWILFKTLYIRQNKVFFFWNGDLYCESGDILGFFESE
jgi:hypothetical protein